MPIVSSRCLKTGGGVQGVGEGTGGCLPRSMWHHSRLSSCPTPDVKECVFTKQAGGPHSQECSVSKQSQVGDQGVGGNRQRLYVTPTQPAVEEMGMRCPLLQARGGGGEIRSRGFVTVAARLE